MILLDYKIIMENTQTELITKILILFEIMIIMLEFLT